MYINVCNIQTAIAALKGPFVGQRGAQYQIFKWPPDYLYIVLVLVGVEQSTKKHFWSQYFVKCGNWGVNFGSEMGAFELKNHVFAVFEC